jgi:hypothetical protein
MIKIVVMIEIAPDGGVNSMFVTLKETDQPTQRYDNVRLCHNDNSLTIENRDTGDVEVKLVNVPVIVYYHRDYMDAQ